MKSLLISIWLLQFIHLQLHSILYFSQLYYKIVCLNCGFNPMKILKGILFLTLFLISYFTVNLATFSFASNQYLDTTSMNKVNDTSVIEIGDRTIKVILAETPTEQSKGLAIKDSMNENEGMFFIFDTPQKYSFWMKDMKFPIDIIWIDTTGKIVHIEKNLQPCIFLLPCASYSPDIDSLYVLEVVSNFTNKYNIKIGDKIESNFISFNNN